MQIRNFEKTNNGKPWRAHETFLIEKEILGYLKGFRGELFSQHPFWSIISARLKDVVVCNGTYRGMPLPTAATDGEVIMVNAQWFLGLPAESRKPTFLHEVGHNALGHPFRRGDRDCRLWNESCDYELNLILKELGYSIPKWLCDDKYKGMSAERIHSILLKEREEQEEEPPDNPGEDPEDGGSGEGGTEESGDPSEDLEGNDEGSQSDDSKGESATGDDDSPAPGDCDEPGQIWDPTSPEGDPLTKEEVSEKMEELAKDIQMASTISKQCGKGSSPSLQRSMDRITKPKMNWKKRMDKWVRDKGTPSGRTWSRLDFFVK